VAHPACDVYALGEEEAGALLDGHKSFASLYNDGVRYYVDGSVVSEQDKAGPAKVYLRFTDTSTKKTVFASSGTGPDLASAARAAAEELGQRVK